MQPVHSFKLRGAYNKMSSLPKDKLNKGIVACRWDGEETAEICIFERDERKVSMIHELLSKKIGKQQF